MVSPTGQPIDPWEIVNYEASMLFDLCRELNQESYRTFPRAIQKAIVESACGRAGTIPDPLRSDAKIIHSGAMADKASAEKSFNAATGLVGHLKQ